MFNRSIERGLLDALEDLGVGCIVFSPLAQGILTDRYLDGIPEDSRARKSDTLHPAFLNEDVLGKVRALRDEAGRREQSVAQMALAWTVRDPRVTSTLVGASSLGQLEQNVAMIDRLEFSSDELEQIESALRLG
jgi:L-glyceraldehyde 3-phosphate reductase